MDINVLKELLSDFKAGRLGEDDVLERLRTLPFEDLRFAKVDHHRSLRRGFPEVVYGAGKSVEQIIAIAESMVNKKTNLLVTRCEDAAGGTPLPRLSPGERDRGTRRLTPPGRPPPRLRYIL